MPKPLLSGPALALGAGLVIAGCGGGGAPSTRTDVLAHFPDLGHRQIAPRLPAHLTPGTVVALALNDRGYVHPAAMRLASDATLSGAHWTGWGAARTVARGTATVRICTSSCGAGHFTHYPARIVFSRIKSCGKVRYYSSAQVSLSTVKGSRPWGAYLQVPCS